MLHRVDAGGVIVVTQPAHAWVAAQMARQWGNDRFGAVVPWEAVCLGAEQHDNGWAAWEQAPTLNPATGRPHTFREMPTEMHIRVWAGAAERTLTQGRYAALLVSLHGSGLYERFHDYTRDTAAEAQAARTFVAAERAFQARLLDDLRRDPFSAPHAAPDVVARNRRLVAVWDALSLGICHGIQTPTTYANVPAAGDRTETLTLAPGESDPACLTVDPWPFRDATVTLICEGRRLPETYSDEAAMRAALAAAPWLTLTIHLAPV